MNPISVIRKSTVSVRTDESDDLNYRRNVAYRTDTSKGLSHLLEGITLEEVLGQPDLHFVHAGIIRRALVDGHFPCGKNRSEDIGFLVWWLAQHKQAKLLSHWLELTPLSIAVLTKETAAGLLAVMQSTLSFSGLALVLTTDLQTNILKEVIPLLMQALQANASLTSIVIFSNNYNSVGLSSLFDVLAKVSGLELIVEGGASDLTACALLGQLLSRNKTLRVLELRSLRSVPPNDGYEAPGAGTAAGVIKHIAGQLQLERLELSTIPPQCQAVIGELMSTSHVLKEMKIGLDGTMIDPALINGFRQTSSVESVHLSVLELEDGMLPLIYSIADGNTSIKSFELFSIYPRVDRNDSPCICRLISGNRNLASLIWRLPEGCNVDLAQVGMALKKNNRLETLMLIEQAESDDDDRPAWINETSVSALVMNLKKNCTLTELVLASKGEMVSPVKKNFSLLQQVLDRNRAFQRYACSDQFLFGAVEGLFATIELPVDTAMGTARALMHYKPRTGAAALALVNKASYANAMFRRRQAQSTMRDHLIPLTSGLVANRRKKMIELLNGVIVCKGSFSNDNISRMVDGLALPGALVAIMLRSPDDYLYLVGVFCQAVGMDKIRSCVTSQIAKSSMLDASESEGTGHAFLLSMLEQSFPPDQKHLLPFVEKELNYEGMDSAAVKLFVGYNIPQVSSIGTNKAALVSWCVENCQPALMMAFYDAGTSKVVIDFTAYSGVFARTMMEKIPQLKKARALSLRGVPSYENALVLYRVLAGPSSLEELRIDGNCCGQEFESLMQGLSLNTRITSLSLSLREMVDPPAIAEMLASLLEANRTIEVIALQLHDDDPEQQQLEQLAAMDDRLELEQVERIG